MKITWTEVNLDGPNGSAAAHLEGGTSLFASCCNSNIVTYGFVLSGEKKETQALLNLGWVGQKRGKDYPDTIDILQEAMNLAEILLNAEFFLSAGGPAVATKL
jgi:hypothetical protein